MRSAEKKRSEKTFLVQLVEETLTSSSGTSKTESKNSHRHDTLALAAVNVGIGSEDVGDGFRGVRLVGHCDKEMETIKSRKRKWQILESE